MKRATIYERKGMFYIRASSLTTGDVWAEDGVCHAVAIDSEYEEIGEHLYAALDYSCYNIPHPTDWRAVSIPLFEAAKVKSWSSFGKMAKCISVNMDKQIQLIPTANMSSRKQGFIHMNDNIITVPIPVDYAELGKKVKEAWLICE